MVRRIWPVGRDFKRQYVCAMAETATIVRKLLRAVGERDIDGIIACLAPDAVWQNVPHPPVEGHLAIRAMLCPMLERSSAVRWDLVTAAYGDDRAWLERVDRFWIGGREFAVRCNGVLEFDTAEGVITEFRDYVDLGEWRTRLPPAGL